MNPGRFFGGIPSASAGWGMPPFFPQMPQMSPERLERWHRIGPILPALKDGLIPTNFTVNPLEKLLSDVKEEGNACFKDKDYGGAYEMYTCALHICKHLQTIHFVTVDRELLSTVFSNRAACLLKMDFYKESIQDCEIAIQQNCENIKAHYRMAVSYKSLRDYSSALESARKGKQQAVNMKKIKEVKEFDDLIREVESHLHPHENVQPSDSAGRSNNQPSSKEKASVENSLKSSKQKSTAIADYQKLNSKTEENKKTGGKVATAAVQQSKPVKENPTDAKKKAENAPKKKVKKKVIPKKSAYEGKFSLLAKDESDSDESEGSDAGGQVSKEDDQGFDNSARVAMGLDDFEAIPVRRKHASGKMNDSSKKLSNVNLPPPGYNNVAKQSSQPLDVNTRAVFHPLNGSYASARLQVQDRRSMSPAAVASQQASPPGFGYSVSNHQQQASNYAVRTVPSLMELTPQPARSTSENQFLRNSWYSPHGDFICIKTRAVNEYPFDGKYDLTLVCDQCYVQTGYGDAGYLCLGNLEHNCDQSTFLIRLKVNPEVGWRKIRPRNQKLKFLGPFRLCHDYSSGQACRISEKDCTFAHSEEEARLWTLDRERQFDIAEFVLQLRLPLDKKAGHDSFQQYPGMTFTNSAFIGNNDFQFQQHKKDFESLPEMQESQDYSQMVDFGFPGYENAYKNYGVAATAETFVPQHQANAFLSPDSVSWAKAAAAREMTKNHQQLRQEPVSWAKAVASKETIKTNRLLYQDQENTQSSKIVFPLNHHCNFRLVCKLCFVSLPDFCSCYWWNAGLSHVCTEDILAVQPKNLNFWVKIRERINHREFAGNYVLCRYYEVGKPYACRRQENCLFAHNREEQYLWTLEKDGQFDIGEFIRQNRSQSALPMFSVVGLLEKHPGELCHICGACFRGLHLLSIQNPQDATRCHTGHHTWQENKMLIHFSTAKVITEIGQRPFTSKGAYFKLCHHQKFCRMRNMGNCKYAHSLIERDLWCVQRDLDWTEDQIVEEAMKINLQKFQSITSSRLETLEKQEKPAQTSAQSAFSRSSPASPSEKSVSSDVPSAAKCPYRVIAVCKLCFQKGAISSCKKDRCDGPGMGHMWDQNKMYLILPSKKKVSALPKFLPRNNNFAICRHMLQKRKCELGHGGQCQFAHSKEEIEVWTWMVNNRITTLDELVASCQKTYEAPSLAAKPIPKGQSVIAVSRAAPVAQPKASPYTSPLDLALNAHYCHYCSIHCNGQKQWDEHCASDKHMFNVNSDKEHQWNYRQPPWGIGGCNYELCDKHIDGGKCRFSEVPDMYNHCQFAHSREELDEWKERWEWRQMKREIAKQEHLYSYMAALREDYEMADLGITVISEEIDGVTVKCSSSLLIFEQKKNATHTWAFEVQAGKQKLHKVALLYDQDRLHFTLLGGDIEKGSQIAPGETFLTSGSAASNVYNIEVKFNSGIYGSFSQLVIFDFDERPVVGKRVNVELGTQFVQEKVKILREKLKFVRWTSDNREVVWFNDNRQVDSDLNSEILLCYKTPSSADVVVTQQTVGVELNRHNYVHKMHKLLQIEELTQAHIMSQFNLQVDVTLLERIVENGFVNARSGELFARVPLSDQLNEDTDAGHLILSGVTTVLFAPLDRCDRTVYEAVLVQKENFDYNGRGRDHIYLCLSARCCEVLNINSGDILEVEIQFQLNRLMVCQMHYALDQLLNTDIVFPDISRVGQTCSQHMQYQLSSDVLNEDQMKIIEYVVAQREGYNPPLVIYGPFGTGKTETLAQAAMILSANDKNARILICTHSNSAADLYISRHFDAFVRQSCPDLKVLRVYAKERRSNTVHSLVQKYCLMSEHRSHFLEPSGRDIRNHQIVITSLVTSLVLTKKDMNLRGYFTHVFIDEAAQVLECETIMPLSLATELTTIVLAGDYNQIAQKVYSKEAQRQRFHCSLVRRLFDHYKTYAYAAEGSLPSILLKRNYRTKMEILRFLAAVFYGGPDKLIACSAQRPIENITPLTFYTAFGREMQDHDSTSYHNMAEIEEIVERVSELCNNWPKDWDEPAAESILVVTPYLDQVQKIRSALRKKSKELSRVSVDRVSNVQGTEFRAVFINTVRTQHLAEEPPRIPANASDCDGEFGDFGFLSDAHLLNTAFTRARSFVAVVGDPVALCAIGECMTIWRTYLKHCQNLKSIHPSTVTLDTIKSRVQSLLNSPVCGPNLQKLSVLHQDAVLGKLTTDADAKLGGEADTDFSNLKPDPNPFDSVTLKGVFEDWSLDYHIEPDSIIQHLAEDTVVLPTGQPKKLTRSDEPLKLSCVRLHEKKGHATLEVLTSGSNESKRQQRLRLTADDSIKDYDSDVDESSEDENDTASATVFVDYMPQQLQELLHRQPERFKHCILKIESSRNIYARLLNCTAPCKQIKISSRLRCGRAFNNDEVVVEILPIDPEDVPALPEGQKDLPQGQVIGILRRAVNPRYRMFVCMVEEDNTGIMIPINRNIPKIYNLEPSQKAKKGHVCVYTFTQDKEPIFHHYEPIDPLKPSSKLFIVRYLKWEAKFYAPLGIVVGVLPVDVTIDQALTILNIEHYIPKKFKDDTLTEVKRICPPRFQIPTKEIFGRLDYRDKVTFTVDPANSKDLDDAISIEDLSNGCFLIGVHVSDVSYFVEKGGCIDVEAESRGVALYPFASDPVPMLPDCLSTDLCSLLPGKDRLTLSVFFTIDAKANIQKVQIKRSVVCSKYHLDYAQLEAVIKHRPLESFEQELPESFCLNVLILNRVAQMWRRRRLGTATIYYGMERSGAEDSPEAHLMIEELMITANHHVAMHLIERFPVSTPLCCQLPPDALELDEWRSKYIEEAKNTVALTQPFKFKGEVCNCLSSCECIPQTPDDSVLVDIRKSTWEEIRVAVLEDDTDKVTSLVICPENHPKTALALMDLYSISNRSQYVCSEDATHDGLNHHSLNISYYVHFTSPIRRYMDIVVHRLLKSCLNEQPSPYSRSDITELCNKCTEVDMKARCYERAVETLHYAKLFQEKPSVMFPVVEALDDELKLRFPLVKMILPHKTMIRFSSLSVSEVPTVDEEKQLLCSWSKRIYDLKPEQQQLSVSSSVTAVLDSNKHIFQTTAVDWRELLWSVVSADKEKILMSVMQVDELLVDSSQDDRFAVDVTSEGVSVRNGHQFSEFSASLRVGNVLQVQVASELLKGMLVPSIQLFSLTPTLNICLEHRVKTTQCFTGPVMLQAAKKSYRNVEAYQAAWLPVLRLEAAHNAVLNDDTVIIHNVGITWQVESTPSVSSVLGSFDIPIHFCRERQITLKTELETEEGKADDTKSNVFQHCHGYLCVQYLNMIMENPKTELPANKLTSLSSLPTTWVGHCIVSRVYYTPDKQSYTVKLRLHQSSCPFPSEMIKQSALQATIEWIFKPLPYSRMEYALCEMTNANQLAIDIALGKNPQQLEESYRLIMDQWKMVEIPVLPAPNQVQIEAINRAVHKPFTLIQGPPGTGKTVVGVQLAYIFAQINKSLPASFEVNFSHPQVLCCGPSNKSVDVLARYLMQLKEQCPKLVRIYNQSSVREEFPLPQDLLLKRKRSNLEIVTEDLKSISLHHKIRSRGSNSTFILEMDKLIRSDPSSVEFKDVKSYLDAVAMAELEILKEAEIILCTCSTSGTSRIWDGTNIQQLILDESGMCMEPEALIPIVGSKARQIVLLGDHKQLEPIVLQSTARNRGLTQSLFERYADKAVTLVTQYRMHESIAKFPSKYFYNDQLRAGKEEQAKPSVLKFWPNGRNKPMAFVHVMGIERALSVATASGNELSQVNAKEVDVTVRSANLLVRRFHVPPKSVAILSQYRAQCSEIETELLKRGEKDIAVSTVVAAQGSEWDYVILSTVRSLPKSAIEKKPSRGWKRRHLGFITDAHQINVALTRAKKGLIIIGNKYLLQCDEIWKKLLRDYEADKKIVDAADFMV